MTDQNEKLSLLLDNYSDGDVDSIIDEVVGDINLQYRTRRYQMIGEAMRNELPWAIDPDFHRIVMTQIHDQAVMFDPAPTVAQKSVLRRSLQNWVTLKFAGGLAVAASVALVTVTLWQSVEQPSGQFDDELVSSAGQQKIQKLAGQQFQAGVIPVSIKVQTGGMRWKVGNTAPADVMQQKLNAYLINHTEQSNSVQGLIPQARVAGFDARQ